LTSRTAKDQFTSVKPFLFLIVFLLLGYPTLCFAAEALEAYSLAQGQMAGEVSDHSVILQTRLTSSDSLLDKTWSGIPGISGWACFQLSSDENFNNSFQTPWIKAIPDYDFIIKTKVTNLKPGKLYYYRVIYGPDSKNSANGLTSSFKTHGGNPQNGVSFAIVTGMNYSRFHYTGLQNNSLRKVPPGSDENKLLGYPALVSILKLKPDYFVGTGDNVYYDTPIVGRAETQQQIRRKYQEQFSQPRFIDLFQQVATYWMKDDHDFRFNDSDPINPYLVTRNYDLDYYPKTNINKYVSGSGSLPSAKLGIRMFQEQLPVIDPEESHPITYRTFRVNDLLQIWFVEGRDYRDANDRPDGPNKSIWGLKQRNWLKETLLQSDAVFKFLISATPMIGPEEEGKRDNHVNPSGFRYEGEAFFDWLSENGFRNKNFYIFCGDRHWQYHAIHPTGFEEFSCGTLVDANTEIGPRPGDPNSSDPEAKIKQPYNTQKPSGGFLIFSVKSSKEKEKPVAKIDFYDENGIVLYTTEKIAEKN